MNHIINGLTRLSTHAPLSAELKSGQLIKGKVIQSLQDNKVVVNLGKKSVEAIVSQSLMKGSSYLFQIEQVEPSLLLRAVSRSEARSEQLDHASLLKQIGVKVNKDNLSLMKAIVNLKVPLNKKDLVQAFSLVQSSSNQPFSRDLLLHMVSRKMPIQPSVYAALSMKYTVEYSQALSDVEHQLGGKSLSLSDEKILSMIRTLRAEPNPYADRDALNRLSSKLAQGSQVTFHLLKKATLIDNKHTLSSFQEEWSQNNPAMDTLPFSKRRVAVSLHQLLLNQLPLTASENQTIKQWMNTSEKILSLWAPQPSDSDFSMLPRQIRSHWSETLRKMVDQKILARITPHLQESTKVFMDKAVTFSDQSQIEKPPFTRTEFSSFVATMQKLFGKQLSMEQQKLLVESLHALSQHVSVSDKDKMWIQLKAIVNETGFNDEHFLARALEKGDVPVQSESSLKSLLIKAANEGSEVKADTANRLINLINGTQIASYQDNPQTLQIALQFPGDFLGALKDVHMNMEGRKNEDGQIDSDYCHVMFYLHLSQLEETVIDLQIVERRVSVVIYNEKPELEKLFKPYQQKLEIGLEKAGFELNSLKARVTKEVSKTPGSNINEEGIEGVDLRI
ncbi:hypothetical protein GLW00_08850 [Halobacillus litoralis]|uniref:Flagellar hook-length control protein-like C-terminal domain-containing protein n=1 Tax=Halobacillus litoralis TaxID=45668 RepID=A0A845FAP3_9BACI|nr:hypothetical protein [Halobacillus litoralis]MYL70959.1 hypothetical protein [Halobacillus litoralis]